MLQEQTDESTAPSPSTARHSTSIRVGKRLWGSSEGRKRAVINQCRNRKNSCPACPPPAPEQAGARPAYGMQKRCSLGGGMVKGLLQ